MDALRCPPENTPVSVLSGVEKRRVALCRLLLKKPDILLIDEPTNHLVAESVAWMDHHLQKYPGTVIAVTHDRYFLENVAGWSSLRATDPSMKPTVKSAWVRMPPGRVASSIDGCPDRRQFEKNGYKNIWRLNCHCVYNGVGT